MNIKLNVATVQRIFNERVPLAQIYTRLMPAAKQAGITLAEFQAGAGYLQWTLPGNEWTPFAKLDDSQKTQAAQEYHDRKMRLADSMKGTGLAEAVLTVPSENDFVYFRHNGESLDIAIVAWAHKYPNRQSGGELDTWRNKCEMQEVNIGFSWDGAALPDIPFKLEKHARRTGSDGLFRLDGKLPVGRKCNVTSPAGCEITLEVKAGQADYIFDLTQYFNISISVTKDNAPLADCECSVTFGGRSTVLVADSLGKATTRMSLAHDNEGLPLPEQPVCSVECCGDIQTQTPQHDGDTLSYVFTFETPHEDEPMPEPQPEPEPQEPAIPEPPKLEPKVEFVKITILDYAGYPLTDMPVTITTRQKGAIQTQTDSNGVCKVQKDWLMPDEKIKVDFAVTPEYQEQHDIHDKKHKTKKK